MATINNCGIRVSPINIDTSKTIPGPCGCYLQYKNYTKKVDWELVDAATTMNVVPSNKYNIYVRYGGVKYYVKNIEFRKTAEHTINGSTCDMECHIVHESETTPAMTLTVSLLLKTTRADDNNGKVIDQMFAKYDECRKATTPPTVCAIEARLCDLIPCGCFYSYCGSTTVTPFVENVHWFVYDNPLYIKEETSDIFTSYYSNNARAIQTQNLGPVYKHKACKKSK